MPVSTNEAHWVRKLPESHIIENQLRLCDPPILDGQRDGVPLCSLEVFSHDGEVKFLEKWRWRVGVVVLEAQQVKLSCSNAEVLLYQESLSFINIHDDKVKSFK